MDVNDYLQRGYNCEVHALQKRIEELEELLQSATCIYCGESFSKDSDLQSHIHACKSHPLHAAITRAEMAEQERDDLRRRLDAVLAMLHLSSSTIHDNWVGYCSSCWWRGDARCADWTEDSGGGMQPECPICGALVDEHPSYTNSVAFYERAKAIAEGRNHE